MERYKPLLNEKNLLNKTKKRDSQKEFKECINLLSTMSMSMRKYIDRILKGNLDISLKEATETGRRVLATFEDAKKKLNDRIDNLDVIDKPLDVTKANNITTLQNRNTHNFYKIIEALDNKRREISHQLDNEDKTVVRNMWSEYIESIEEMNSKIKIHNDNYPTHKINLLVFQ